MKTASALTALLLLGVGCSSPSHGTRAEAARSVEGGATRTIAIVRVHAPWYAPRFAIVSRFCDAVPEYEGLAHLEEKYFTIAEERRFGGIYVWRSRDDAESYHSPAWRSAIYDRRGTAPELLLLDAPFLVEGRATLRGEPLGARALRSPATSAVVLWETRTDGAAAILAESLTRSANEPGGADLVKAYVVTFGASRVGFVGVWPSRQSASAATGENALEKLAAGLGVVSSEVTLFDTPVLIAADLRDDGRRQSRAP